MSREPSSSAHVFLQSQAESPRPEPLSALFETKVEPPPSDPTALPYRRRSFTVRVEPKKKPRRPPRVTDEAGNSPATNRALSKKRAQAKPKRDPYATRWSDLTPDEMASFVIYPKENR